MSSIHSNLSIHCILIESIHSSISAWSNYGPAEQFCTSLVDYKQRQPFFFREHSDFGTKISRLRPASSNNFEKWPTRVQKLDHPDLFIRIHSFERIY